MEVVLYLCITPGLWLELVLIISRPIMSHILDLTLPDHDSGDSGETRTDKSSEAIPVLNPSRITGGDSSSARTGQVLHSSSDLKDN